MSGRGWSAGDLPLVGDDPALWTVAEAAVFLGPPTLPLDKVRSLVRSFKILQPVGRRRTVANGKPGRCARVYRAEDFIDAYEKSS